MKILLAVVLLLSMAGCGGENSKNGTSSNKTSLEDDAKKLRFLATAIHNYHDTFGEFPFNYKKRKEINAGLSWRVKVLPFFDQESLHRQFDISKPWDSEKNRGLIAAGKDEFTLSNGSLVCTIQHQFPAVNYAKIIDGVSNTVMLIENPTLDGEKWTQPVDLSVTDAITLIKSLKKGKFLMATLFDGSNVRIYSIDGKSISDAELSAIFVYNDSAITNFDIFKE